MVILVYLGEQGIVIIPEVTLFGRAVGCHAGRLAIIGVALSTLLIMALIRLPSRIPFRVIPIVIAAQEYISVLFVEREAEKVGLLTTPIRVIVALVLVPSCPTHISLTIHSSILMV
jgi:hypothetical protein